MNSIGGIASTPASQPAGKGNDITLQSLRRQYPHLNMSAQSFANQAAIKDYAMKQSGKYNVAIDPRAIARMNEDGEFADKMHTNLSEVEYAHDWIENEINSHPNTNMIACGTVIDKDGNVGHWCVSQSSSESEGVFSRSQKSREDLLEKVQKKRQEKKDEEERLEQKKQRDDSLHVSLEAGISVDTEQKTMAGTAPQDGTINIQA